ncbi:hypothetical protein G6F59_015046 [Rhizopus arrhizus]|nr:hypothetical protein G6F59_015046 [Rhizopus arrhizus]
MAGNEVIGSNLHQRLHHRLVAELADRAGDFIGQQGALQMAARRIGDRHGRHQLLGVRVLRILENGAARADLDDLAQVHHGHAMADTFDHGHVVRNEQVRQAPLGLQFLHQFDHARLLRHVQRGHGRVRHDDLGVHRQRSRDAQALALPAREFMRKAPDGVRRQSHQFEKLLRKRQRLTPGHAVHHGTLGHNFAHALTGIQ